MEDIFLILIAAMVLLVLLRIERTSRDIKSLRAYVEQLRAVVDKLDRQVTTSHELSSGLDAGEAANLRTIQRDEHP